MSSKEGVPADKLTKAYIKVRGQRAALAAEFKDADAVLSRKLDTIKNALLDYCEDYNVESVRTSEGLFFRTSKVKYWTSDWEQMHSFILEHKVPELLDKRLNQTNLKQFLEENPDDVPKGLNTQNEYTISVRKK